MEFLQLRYFFESAKNESFVKTAKKYMVPPASVSASVKRLEKELGCELFHRTSNRIYLNEKGRRLQESLKVAFAEIDSAVDKISSVSNDTGEIKLLVRAMRNTITDYIVEYKTNHPNIAFNTVFDFDDINVEDYDVIIDEESEGYKGYEKHTLFNTEIQLCASSSSPFCGKKLVLKQLCDQPFISIGANNGMHKKFADICKAAGFTPKVIVRCNDLQCNRKFVRAGIGIGLSRAHPWGEQLEGIEVLRVTDFSQTQTICCYYKKQFVYGNVTHFINFLKNKGNL